MFTARLARLALGVCLISALLPALVACEDNDDKSLASAQACLNHAVPATADQCLLPIAGQTSDAAFAIRCSVDFLAQGFDTTRWTNAFKDLSTTGAATNPMLTAVAYLSFYPTLPTGHTSDNAISNCSQSNADSYRRIAEFAKYATTMAPQPSASSVQSVSSAQSAIQTNKSNVSIATDVGNQTVTMYQDFCVEKSPFSSTEICTTIGAHINDGTPALIGFGVMNALAP